jgi:hypothetical protein
MSSPAESLVKAERSLQKAFGLSAVFKSYSGASRSLVVMSKGKATTQEAGGFARNDNDPTFDVVFADLPEDWRDGSLEVEGRLYHVVDVLPDSYKALAEVRVE